MARFSHPLALHAVKQMAAEHGVCIRPVLMRRTDLDTGRTDVIDLPCGSTRESRCPACAKKAKRLREQQCREGWHRADEPLPAPKTNAEQKDLLTERADFEFLRADCLSRAEWHRIPGIDAAIDELEEQIAASGIRGRVAPARPEPGQGGGQPRRTRSTRRRQDAPKLPRRTVTARTIGRTFEGNQGRIFRPSTFITLTLDSYGRVREDGSPADPNSYDYRRAAWDAVHFPALIDRFWQNLRRAEGWNVQYFGSVEPQRRLAPHTHFAVRGSLPRKVLRQVAEATYHQVWWPSTATVLYPDHAAQPVWQPDGGPDRTGTYVDPDTGVPLPTWAEALDQLDDELDADPDRGPEYVVRFGRQLDAQGVLAGTPEADKLIGYATKYITKSVSECHTIDTGAQAEHQRRLWAGLRITPCSERCPNWLRYGIQPANVRAGLRAGYCKAKVHQLDTLGIGGRRVLVSRNWSGKTLADHRYDQAAWVRQVLAAGLGHTNPPGDVQAEPVDAAGMVAWERAGPHDPGVDDLPRRLLRAIATRIHHRAAIAAARAADPPGGISATGTDVRRRESE
jgi:hypothetical protein